MANRNVLITYLMIFLALGLVFTVAAASVDTPHRKLLDAVVVRWRPGYSCCYKACHGSCAWPTLPTAGRHAFAASAVYNVPVGLLASIQVLHRHRAPMPGTSCIVGAHYILNAVHAQPHLDVCADWAPLDFWFPLHGNHTWQDLSDWLALFTGVSGPNYSACEGSCHGCDYNC